MKYKLTVFIVFFLVAAYFPAPSYPANIKEPSAAGTFYPDNPKELSKMLDSLISQAKPEKSYSDVFILIVPHAGYGFSGKAASAAYKLLKPNKYRTVVIIGTGHHYGFSGISVYPEGKFITPLGSIEVDREFARKLLNQEKDIYFQPLAYEKEHSVEVQLPFLQKSLKGFKIVPIVTGDCTLSACNKLALLLKEAIGSRKDVLIVVSTDLYHGYDFEEAEKTDNLTVSFINNMDAEGLYYGLRDGKLQMCGGFGVVSAISLSSYLGYDKPRLIEYTNSSKVTGKMIKGIWTVGYASIVIDSKREDNAMLSKEERKKLLKIARSSIENYLKTGERLPLTETDPLLLEELGAFVTLHKRGELRGCIGNIIGRGPLYLTIRNMAIESATGDPRFSKVTLEELKDIDIEISVLSPMKKTDNPDDIRLGIDGVLIRKGFRSGVFLPQVATETGWSRDEFMSNLCAHKAGLAPEAWKGDDVEIYTFTAEVFSEKEL